MAKDEIDASEVLKKLAELKKTLPEDQYQELERQVLPRLAEHFEGEPKAGKGTQLAATLVRIVLFVGIWVILIAITNQQPTRWWHFVIGIPLLILQWLIIR